MLTRGRRTTYATATVAALVGLTGCDTSGGFGSDGDGITDASATSRVLVASASYAQTHPDAGTRLGVLGDAMTRLREQTSSGWTGRQDDETGYLGELSGGRWFGDVGDVDSAVTSLLDTYGPDLFGIDAGDVLLGSLSEPLASGSATMRLTQRVGDVPVLDAALTASIGAAGTDPRVNGVRGRVYPGLDVSTNPSIGAARARRIAVRLSGGGTTRGRPDLFVLPIGSGELAWEVPVMGVVTDTGSVGGGTQGSGQLAGSVYYVSATTGRLVTERPIGTEVAPLTAGLETSTLHRVRVTRFRFARAVAEGQVVEIHGTGPTGEALTSHGLRTPEGVRLVDTTLPGYDPATGRGTIDVYDMGRTEDDARLPGEPVIAEGPDVSNADAIAALAYTRMVHDYYLETHGRSSWDGEGRAMTSSINYGAGNTCNAFFTGQFGQMLYGPPCEGPGGLGQLVTLDATGHEITHGVVSTTSNLVYFGQSGALNEAFADYFGNVIGDEHEGHDSTVIGEDLCRAVTQPQNLCETMPDGALALRDLLNGTTFDDYLRSLTPSTKLELIEDYSTDQGGVHLNSAIWNNALWSIRTQLATMDGTAAVESERASTFTQAVFLAMTTRLTPQATYVDARDAVLASLVDVQADPEIVRVATQTFDQSRICAGCGETSSSPGTVVDVQPGRQTAPAINGDVVTWLDVDVASLYGTATSARYDGTGLTSGAEGGALAVGFAGDAIVVLDYQSGRVVRYADEGATVLGQVDVVDAAARGLAGSADGAAWFDRLTNTVQHVDPSGTLTSVSAEGLGTVYSMAAGGGTVAMGTKGGDVFRWAPGGQVELVGNVGGAVLSLAVHGDRTLAVTGGGSVVLFEGTTARPLSDSGMPFGAALSSGHAVWAERVGDLDGAIAADLSGSLLAVDTDLFTYSFESGKIYDLLSLPGQQGYPSLSGDRIAWQDSALGDDDVFTATMPDGL